MAIFHRYLKFPEGYVGMSRQAVRSPICEAIDPSTLHLAQ